ncbi:MAG: cytochrome c [Campylobacteraceae bacterium]|nr:cytochrome c [Campylobacteraceae bacterium]
MNKPFICLIFLSTLLIASSNNSDTSRWYTQKQVKNGQILFLNNCALCHGQKAQKTVNWKKTLKDGSYPPPPLNGSAHAWHHPKSQLKRIISNGGKSYDGKMPGFKSKLTSEDMDSVISYFQSFWDDEQYSLWKKNGGLTR